MKRERDRAVADEDSSVVKPETERVGRVNISMAKKSLLIGFEVKVNTEEESSVSADTPLEIKVLWMNRYGKLCLTSKKGSIKTNDISFNLKSIRLVTVEKNTDLNLDVVSIYAHNIRYPMEFYTPDTSKLKILLETVAEYLSKKYEITKGRRKS